MSDPVAIAAIGCIGTVTAAAVAVVGVVLSRKLTALDIRVDGRLTELLESRTRGARAEGNLEGRAELHEENKQSS